MGETGSEQADVAEALNCHRGPFEAFTEIAQKILSDANNAITRRRLTAFAAVEFNRFARDHCGRKHMESRVMIHDPRHNLRIGVHVRRGYVALRSDFLANPFDELAGDAF
jgi:hypothetical protein